MRVEYPEFVHHAETLVAVAIGAVLATLGGFVATRIEARLHRVHREKTAALIFGEILASLRVLIRAVEDSHGRGDPFGPLTRRLLHGARRELEAYERSRIALSDVRDPKLRLAIHALMTRISLAVDGIIEAVADADRIGSYDYLIHIAPNIDGLVKDLLPLAGQPLSPYDALSQEPGGGQPAAASPVPPVAQTAATPQAPA